MQTAHRNASWHSWSPSQTFLLYFQNTLNCIIVYKNKQILF